MKITFYYVRHGQTLFNVIERMQGECDSPLTEAGIEGAKDTASALRKVHFAGCYSSSSERTLDTADILCEPHPGLKPVPMKELKEFDFGDLDGQKLSEFRDSVNETEMQDDWTSFHGENMKHFDERSRRAFKRIISESKDGDNVLLVSHGSFIVHLMKTLLGFDRDSYIERCNKVSRPWMPNTGICIFTYEDGKWKVAEEPMYAEEYRRRHDPKKVTFYFVRHGETLFNVNDRLQGRCDSPLTEKGIGQAEDAGRKLKNVPFDAVYCSYAERARDTADIILKGRNLNAVWEKRLREVSCGSLEGSHPSEIGEKQLQERSLNEHFKDVGGEDYEDIAGRLRAFLRDAYDKAEDGDRILLVSHGGMYFTLLHALFDTDIERLLADAEKTHTNPAPNGGISIFTVENGKYELLQKMSDNK